jgi:hypothetical protein
VVVHHPGSVVVAPGGVLKHTLEATYAAGTNLKGRAAGAAWTFLLPTLELDVVTCLGLSSAATLLTLGRLSADMRVACSRRRREAAERRVAALAMANVEVLDPDDDRLMVPADLALLGEGAPGYNLTAAVIARAANVYVDGATWTGQPWQPLWMSPRAGEVRRAAALDDKRTIAFLRDAAAADLRAGTRLRRAARHVVRREEGGERRGLLRGASSGPPAYVCEIASRGGVDLSGCRVGVSAPSEYASRKAILFVFSADEPTPRWVVKITREPEHNRRLDNEWDALVRLRDAGVGDERSLPRPAFRGCHAGLAIVGETAVAGTPLRSRTSAAADCPLAAAALRWLLELGERSAAVPQDNAVAAAALDELMGRFLALYDLDDGQHTALTEQIDRIRHARPLPLVFQHGDPGTWNVLVADDGRPIFLDWEAFEPYGLPLWDAVYFARSHVMTVGRAAGGRDALEIVRRAWLEDTPAVRDFARVIREHRDRIGLERDLIEPLFTTCWMHRALKEAGRLTAARLQHSHYAGLLRMVLDRPDAPGLRRLYGTA